jgi:hypothetical protein
MVVDQDIGVDPDDPLILLQDVVAQNEALLPSR